MPGRTELSCSGAKCALAISQHSVCPRIQCQRNAFMNALLPCLLAFCYMNLYA